LRSGTFDTARMSCPVLQSTATALTTTLAEFSALLPSCSDQQTALKLCRVQQINPSVYESIKAAIGLSKACIQPATELDRCIKSREKTKQVILQNCGGGGHAQLGHRYNQCLQANNGVELACTHVLQEFLDCARKAVVVVEA